MSYRLGICHIGLGYVIQAWDMSYRLGICHTGLGYVIQAWDMLCGHGMGVSLTNRYDKNNYECK